MTVDGDHSTIMIVDDQNTMALEQLLAADGYEVVAADNGLTALSLLSARPVDLVVLDIAMPGMDGYEVLRRIRALPDGEHVPVLMASARYTNSVDAAHGIRLGADDYILKPFDFVELKARISAKLRQRRLEQALRRAREEAEVQGDLLRLTLAMLQRAAPSLDPDTLIATLLHDLTDEAVAARAAIWRVNRGQLAPTPPDAPPLPAGIRAVLENGGHTTNGDRAILPLRIAHRLEGALDLSRPAGWSEGELTILQALADALAILMQNTRYVQQIARENQFHELLNELAVREETRLPDVLATLRRFLRLRLVLVDPWLNVLESEEIQGLVEQEQLLPAVVEAYQRHRVAEQVGERRRSVQLTRDHEVRPHKVYPVLMGGEVSALLLAVPPNTGPLDFRPPELEIEQAARFIAGLLERERESELREVTVRADFLSDFLSGRLAGELSRPALFLRANAMGLNLARPTLVAQIELPAFDEMVDWSQPLFERRVSEILDPLVRDARRAREPLNLEGVEVAVGQRVLALLSFDPVTQEEAARSMALRWAEALEELYAFRSGGKGPRPAIGLGRLAPHWEALPRSAGEADRALRWLLRSQAAERVAYYGDLGSERLLSAVRDPAELRRFHGDLLGALIEYDAQRSGELVQTLRVYFEYGGKASRASEVLNIHPNTLKNRLDHVRELTGRDPRDPAASFDYQLALRIHSMI